MKTKKVLQCPVCRSKTVELKDSFCVCMNCGYETAGVPKDGLKSYYNDKDLGLKVQNILEEDGFESPLRNYHKKALSSIGTLSKKRVCDIGCGVGVFLKEVRFLGGHPYGYDINETQAQIARSKYKLTKVNAAFSLKEYCQKQKISKGFFDVITAFEVIEHVPDINQFIDEAHEYLRKGGYLILSTPNRDRFYMHERWDYPPIHLSRITKKAMEILIKRHYFSMMYWTSFNELGYYSNNLIHKMSLSQQVLSSVVDSGESDTGTTKWKLNLITNTKRILCIILDIPIFVFLLFFPKKGHTMFVGAKKIS